MNTITDITTITVYDRQNGNFWTAFWVIFTIAILWHLKWWILGAVIILGGAYLIWRGLTADARRQQALRDRADQQNNWVYAGDPRGFYGDSHEGQVK